MSGWRIDLHHIFDSPPDPRLDQVVSLLQQLRQDVSIMSGTVSNLDTAITALTAQVQAQTDVDAAAMTMIQGIPAMIATAVAAAQAAGATPAQLQAITDLGTKLDAASGPLSAAVTANTTTQVVTPPTP